MTQKPMNHRANMQKKPIAMLNYPLGTPDELSAGLLKAEAARLLAERKSAALALALADAHQQRDKAMVCMGAFFIALHGLPVQADPKFIDTVEKVGQRIMQEVWVEYEQSAPPTNEEGIT